MIENITPQDALAKANTGITFIDVREPYETDELGYKVETLKLMPLSDFQNQLDSLSKEDELIFACKSGGRSMQVCEFLASQGFTKLYNVDGGIMRWKLEGLPIQ